MLTPEVMHSSGGRIFFFSLLMFNPEKSPSTFGGSTAVIRLSLLLYPERFPKPPDITTTALVQHQVEVVSSTDRCTEIYSRQPLPHRELTCTHFPHLTAVSRQGVVRNYPGLIPYSVPPAASLQSVGFFIGDTWFHSGSFLSCLWHSRM